MLFAPGTVLCISSTEICLSAAYLSAYEPSTTYIVNVFGTPSNTWSPIFETLSGIVMLVYAVHLLNARFPILFTLFGKTMLFKELHP